MRNLTAIFFFVFISAAVASARVAVFPSVVTDKGPIFGFATNKGTFNFLGVPFASPPTGDLRFAEPIEHAPWPLPLNATQFSPGCVSFCQNPVPEFMCTPHVSEDCLYLNVFTPTLDTTAKLPVIFFMHGGAYAFGSGGVPWFDGTTWAASQQVVLVTINYRLNIFGGLYTGTVGGNLMLLDQRMAMAWVHNNIQRFGGDPSRVTISGQSAGAASVAAHLVSQGSWQFFQRAAIASNPFGCLPNTIALAEGLGTEALRMLNCPKGGPAELACLRNKSAEELLNVSFIDFPPSPDTALAQFLPWGPVIDGKVLPQEPLQAMQAGNIHRIPLFIGTVANETIPFVYGMMFTQPMSTQQLEQALVYFWGQSEGTAMEAMYPPEPVRYSNDERPVFAKAFTDYAFYCASRYAAKWASEYNGGRTYMYLFDQIPSYSAWMMPMCARWVCHEMDLVAVFQTFDLLPAAAPRPSFDELRMSTWMQTMWSQFAAEGYITDWPAFTKDSLSAVNISIPVSAQPLVGYREEFCKYFDSVGYTRR